MALAFHSLRLVAAFFCAGVALVGRAEAAAQLYSIGEPTGEEQQDLELINRARANPAAEGARLDATTDPQVLSALQYFGVNLALFQQQMNALPAAPPLAFNGKLLAAARVHSQDMLAFAYQDHIGTDGSTPGSRMLAQGYAWSTYGENTFSHSETVFYGHAAFEFDWSDSVATGGMQVPPTHRLNLHDATLREIGVGVIDGSNGDVGPQLVTEDLAAPLGIAVPLLTGVVYADTNANGSYDAGEGVDGVTVTVAGANFYAVTAPSGGYTVPLPNDGAYSVTFSGGGLADEQATATVVNGQNVKRDYILAAASGSTARLVNISTRLPVGTGDNALIGGFILTGSAPKTVLLRGLGPSLGLNGTLRGVLLNPTLELRGSAGQLITSNDDWSTNTNSAAIATSGVAPNDPREAALLVTLPANGNAYTAILRGVEDTIGIGLVEIYDLDATAPAELANISTRGLVQTGDNVMIGGFIVDQSAARVIVRALGPSLGLAGRLADPTLELIDRDGVSLGMNDDWRSDQAAEIVETQLAPANDHEAVLVRTLAPGAYTVIVRGANGTSGLAVVEAYRLP
ncbi:MAG: hypothetical protein GIW94_12005 [Candidatus Eremiobacteraeota bacterium]|nr:hypothetical protein [Candidatus Eremiobacteraeota bacterium]